MTTPKNTQPEVAAPQSVTVAQAADMSVITPAREHSTFASRKAEREAREAADAASGIAPQSRTRSTFRAGADAENPVFVVTHVQG